MAAVVQFPLLIDLIDNHSPDSLAVPTTWPRGSLGAAAMFTLDTGSPLGGPAWTGTFGIDRIGWAVLVVPTLALLTTTGWRLAISIRAAFVAAGGFTMVWLVDQGWWQGPTCHPSCCSFPSPWALHGRPPQPSPTWERPSPCRVAAPTGERPSSRRRPCPGPHRAARGRRFPRTAAVGMPEPTFRQHCRSSPKRAQVSATPPVVVTTGCCGSANPRSFPQSACR